MIRIARSLPVVVAMAFVLAPAHHSAHAQQLQLLGIDGSTPVQGGGSNPLAPAESLVDGGRAEFVEWGSSEGKATFSMISRAIPGRSDVVAVEATVSVGGIKNGGGESVYYVLDPDSPYTRFHGGGGTGSTGIDESRGIRRDNPTDDFRLFFIGKPGAPVVAWIGVYREWKIAGHKFLPTSHGSIEVKGTVPGVTGKVAPVKK